MESQKLKPRRQNYLAWKEERILDFRDGEIERMYNQGFVFTRLGKGVMQQTRSLRIDLKRFSLSSENRRVLKKVEGLEISAESLPLPSYDWRIGKMAKFFYEKFGEKTFSANKVKELLTDREKSNFNVLLSYSPGVPGAKLGYTICYAGEKFIHYSYPFYSLDLNYAKDMGLGMMTMAIMLAQEEGDRYCYLGSASRASDTYKLQFSGLEWFDGKAWRDDYKGLKEILRSV
jgi:leucyl-tRNA---protein transferase